MYVAHRNVCSSLEAHLAAVEAMLARIPASCQILYLVYCIVHKVKIRGGSTGTWEQKRILKNRYSVFIQDISDLHSTVYSFFKSKMFRFRLECPDGRLSRSHLRNLFQKVFPDGRYSIHLSINQLHTQLINQKNSLLNDNRVGQPFFSKERNVRAFCPVLYKRTDRFLRSFPFFIKERKDLCVLSRSL